MKMELDFSLAPNTLFTIGDFPVTNSFFWGVLISVFLMVLAIVFNSSIKKKPGKIQNFIEFIIEAAYQFMDTVTNNKEKTKKLFPLIFTMFFFILLTNLFTYLPGQSALTIETAGGAVPLFRAVMADYGMVFVLTAISVLLFQIIAIASSGPFGYLKKFITFKSPLAFFLGIMDIVGELAKVVSLSFRLFGNIFAGEVLGSVILSLLPFFMPIPFLGLGLLTAVVQAFVFSVLTLIFATMAGEMEEAEEESVAESGEAPKKERWKQDRQKKATAVTE